jgi:ERCC4-type nuclease
LLPEPVKVDHREPFDLHFLLFELGLEVKVVNNQPIDYIYRDIAFSRKTTTDFASTLFSGSRDLWLEMEKMEHYPYRYLLISGDWNDVLEWSSDPVAKMHSLIGAMVSVEGKYGVRVMHFPDDESLAYAMFKLCEKTYNGGRQTAHVKKPTRKRGLSEKEQALTFLCSLPNIGKKTALNIIKEHGSVWDFLTSSEKRSGRIRRLLQKNFR